LRNTLDTYTQELDNMPSNEEVDEQIKELNGKIKDLETEINKLNNGRSKDEEKKKGLLTQREEILASLAELRNVQKKKEKALNMRWIDTYKAYCWVKDHQNLFQDKIYGPVCLEMSVEVPQHAQYLEQCLGSTLGAFIVLSKRDRDILMTELCTKQNLRLQILFTPNLDGLVHQHPCHISVLQPYGIHHFLDEVFESDPVVKKTLCNYGIHTIGAGSPHTEQNFHHVWSKTNLKEFYTPNAQHRKIQSLYGNKSASTSRIPLRTFKDSVLSASADPDEEARLVEDEKVIAKDLQGLEQELQKCTKSEQGLREKSKELKMTKDKLVKTKAKRDLLKKRIETQKNLIQSLNNEENIEDQEKKIMDRIKDLTLQRVQSVNAMLAVIRELTETTLQSDLLLLDKTKQRHDLAKMETKLLQHSGALRVAEEEELAATEAFNTSRNRAKELMNKAKAVIDVEDEEVKELFLELPNTLDGLEYEINETKACADAIFLANPKILEDYEHRENEIIKLQQVIEEAEQNQEESNTNIEKLKREWLPKLEEVIDKINTSFEQYMANVGCAGQVKLEQKEDFAEWAIEIFVKFRDNEPVCRLDSHVQSGGERSVATMLYLLSLQDLTDSPFRLVDEINQGMDPTNERMIFQQIVKTACKEGLPQYFLITPKLLTDLKYSEDVTILCIFNGPGIPEHWNPLDTLKK